MMRHTIGLLALTLSAAALAVEPLTIKQLRTRAYQDLKAVAQPIERDLMQHAADTGDAGPLIEHGKKIAYWKDLIAEVFGEATQPSDAPNAGRRFKFFNSEDAILAMHLRPRGVPDLLEKTPAEVLFYRGIMTPGHWVIEAPYDHDQAFGVEFPTAGAGCELRHHMDTAGLRSECPSYLTTIGAEGTSWPYTQLEANDYFVSTIWERLECSTRKGPHGHFTPCGDLYHKTGIVNRVDHGVPETCPHVAFIGQKARIPIPPFDLKINRKGRVLNSPPQILIDEGSLSYPDFIPEERPRAVVGFRTFVNSPSLPPLDIIENPYEKQPVLGPWIETDFGPDGAADYSFPANACIHTNSGQAHCEVILQYKDLAGGDKVLIRAISDNGYEYMNTCLQWIKRS